MTDVTVSGVNNEGQAINVNIESNPLQAIAHALSRIADALEEQNRKP